MHAAAIADGVVFIPSFAQWSPDSHLPRVPHAASESQSSSQVGERGLIAMAAALLTTALLASIYPDGHFDTVTQLTSSNIDATIEGALNEGKTLFVRFIASEG